MIETEHDGCLVSTDAARLDLEVIHGFLSRAYWSEGIPRALVERAMRNSLCFGAYLEGRQAGFARVISDYATYAYVADVFVLEPYRGRGISKRLMEAVLAHPELQGLRRWGLVTHDAHGLYRQFGFTPVAQAERHMEILKSGLYTSSAR
ncbi:MAG: GNAT family N-acetyltransferase [Terriglobales bacterium]